MGVGLILRGDCWRRVVTRIILIQEFIGARLFLKGMPLTPWLRAWTCQVDPDPFSCLVFHREHRVRWAELRQASIKSPANGELSLAYALLTVENQPKNGSRSVCCEPPTPPSPQKKKSCLLSGADPGAWEHAPFSSTQKWRGGGGLAGQRIPRLTLNHSDWLL